MRRNVAGQYVGAQLVSKTDGSAVTSGTTTVYVTGDAGTQAAGSVGSGACTHEGQGFWTYAPAQAETNYTHVAFTFVNTSAVNATVQIYPIAYDASGQMTGVTVGTISANVITSTAIQDGAITNAKVADDVDVNVKTITAGAITAAAIATGAIDADALAADAVAEIADGVWDEAIAGHVSAGSTGEALNNAGAAANPWTDTLGTYVAGQAGYILLNNLNATVSSRASQTSLDTLDDYVDTEVAAIKAKTDSLTFTLAGKIDANILAIAGDTTCATNLQRSTAAIVRGTASGTPSTTSIPTSSLSPAVTVADQLKGRIVIFDKDTTTAALRGQATDITANTDVGVLTVTALTTAPVSGDTFTVT